ncbi:helix-turn-helix transcriptional regulator [Streptomyces oceani]|uniref:HTH luxR-type domain-containing protein n=1 Tax=Streptomyces oceani TaxID=1075402 RepID=A0A1E7KFE3_9ACTN|nr:LuxR family transcriptional regulator [Streptomyces oceani]OEV02638.1 hypothetical protein AN216_14115 [Streptomyces oceani]
MKRNHRLLEREKEIDLLRSALGRASSGDGGVLILEGGRGLGKSSVLRYARDEAESREFRVLHARGSRFEQNFSWVVVRQLFECSLVSVAAGKDDGGAALSGPATLIGTLFDYDQDSPQGQLEGSGENSLYSSVHGLYWLCRNLASDRPLMLVIDDVQWADPFSVHFVSYLANRLEGEPVLVVLASTPVPSQPCVTQDLITAVSAAPSATVTRLSPLSAMAVREIMTERLDRAPHEAVVDACMTLTEGDPLHLTELVEEMAARGVEPVESAVPCLPLLTPTRLAWDIRRQFSGLSEGALALANAVAVLENHADPRHCALVADIPEDEINDEIERLRDAHILKPGVPCSFVSSVTRHVVYADMVPRERAAAHQRAALALRAAGADDATVAEHLCRTDSGAPSWAAEVLCSAARAAVRGGTPTDAARYLRCVPKAEPPEPLRVSALAELGLVELQAREPEAVDHLTEASHRFRGAAISHAVRTDLAVALAASGRQCEAADVVQAYLGTGSRGGKGGDDETQPVPGHSRAAARVLLRMTPGREHRCSMTVREVSGEALRAHSAIEAWNRGRPAVRVARLASSAVASGARLPPRDTELPPVSVGAWTLAQCDDLPAAERVLTDVMTAASYSGHLLAAATAKSLHARVLLDTGRLAEAEEAAGAVLRHHGDRSLAVAAAPLAAAVAVHCLIDTGRQEEADELLAVTGFARQLSDAAQFVPLRLARGRLRIRMERFDEGLRELLDCRELALAENWLYPSATCEYFAEAARGLAATRGVRVARTLAVEEVARCRDFGAARPIAAALRTLAALLNGTAAIAKLEEAEQLLTDVPDTLERARTLVELGAALRRAGSRTEARQRLTTGLELAHGIGAADIEDTARSELRLAGTRLAKVGDGPRVPLTPAEERVARKAATGLSNKEISQTLFVTVKTVEWHLGQVYAKLGIARRSELPRALVGPCGVRAQPTS